MKSLVFVCSHAREELVAVFKQEAEGDVDKPQGSGMQLGLFIAEHAAGIAPDVAIGIVRGMLRSGAKLAKENNTEWGRSQREEAMAIILKKIDETVMWYARSENHKPVAPSTS